MVAGHVPVMLDEAVRFMNCGSGKIYADCTLGGAGHSRAILEKTSPDGTLIGTDRDKNAIRNAGEFLHRYKDRIHLFHGNFTRLPEFLSGLGLRSVDGVLLDLGISSDQMESSGRGFSFKKDEPLDMRMDTDSETSAYDLVNSLPETELAKIFWEYGEERRSRRIARGIAGRRKRGPIRTGAELARIVTESIPAKERHGKRIHPATRVFMALRIAVNRELESLEEFLGKLAEDQGAILNKGGRICVISFHSLEDRIVKRWMKKLASGCECPPGLPVCSCGREPVLKILTRKVVRPSDGEVKANPLARSAKLRVAEKL